VLNNRSRFLIADRSDRLWSRSPSRLYSHDRGKLQQIRKPANGLSKAFEASKAIKSYKADQADEIPNEGPRKSESPKASVHRFPDVRPCP
jgi:hypothetical protein